MMGTFKGLDYFKWAKEIDVISWDNYPSYNTPWSMVAMKHDLMRGLKDKPFMLMEQTPSQQNWQPYNSLKRPGQMRAQSYQTMAHGADTIQFSSSVAVWEDVRSSTVLSLHMQERKIQESSAR